MTPFYPTAASQPDCIPNQGCYKGNMCRGNLRTRCTALQELPFQERAFDVNLGGRTIPMIGNGSRSAIGDHVDIESDLRVHQTRRRAGCNSFRWRDGGGMNFLPYEWQQADTRPNHFTVSTRNVIKCLDIPQCNIIDSEQQKKRMDDCARYGYRSRVKRNVLF